MTGLFKAFRLVNPHSSMKLEVKDPEGAIIEWSFLGGSVQALARLGIGKTGPNALKPGDEITVTCVPAADGKSPLGFCQRSPTRTGTWSVSGPPMSRGIFRFA